MTSNAFVFFWQIWLFRTRLSLALTHTVNYFTPCHSVKQVKGGQQMWKIILFRSGKERNMPVSNNRYQNPCKTSKRRRRRKKDFIYFRLSSLLHISQKWWGTCLSNMLMSAFLTGPTWGFLKLLWFFFFFNHSQLTHGEKEVRETTRAVWRPRETSGCCSTGRQGGRGRGGSVSCVTRGVVAAAASAVDIKFPLCRNSR